MHYNSFDFLKVFNFERVGGSEKELEAANLLLKEMKRRNFIQCIQETIIL